MDGVLDDMCKDDRRNTCLPDEAILEPNLMRNLALYVHIPFCIRKCRYCDFASYPVTDRSLLDNYLECLKTESAARALDSFNTARRAGFTNVCDIEKALRTAAGTGMNAIPCASYRVPGERELHGRRSRNGRGPQVGRTVKARERIREPGSIEVFHDVL
jgi:hypothetical protein